MKSWKHGYNPKKQRAGRRKNQPDWEPARVNQSVDFMIKLPYGMSGNDPEAKKYLRNNPKPCVAKSRDKVWVSKPEP